MEKVVEHTRSVSIGKVESVFKLQKDAFNRNPYPSLQERLESLKKLEQLILENQKSIAKAISEDFGNRAIQETKIAEIYGCIEEIRYTRKRLKKWMKIQKRHVPLLLRGVKNRVLPQPKGVVAIVTPWNYPLLLSVGPLVSAISAGNRCMIKMAANSRALSALLHQLFNRFFSEDLVAILPGVSAMEFTAQAYDHMIFTGSGKVGKVVMRRASDHLTPVTLELGGKSPAIICGDFDENIAAERILSSKFFNAGQTCVAPDYLLIPEEKLSGFLESAKRLVPKWYPSLNSEDYTSIVDEKAFNRLNTCLTDALEKGATVLPLLDVENNKGLQKIAPTLVLNPTEDMSLLREEIFGPILPILTYRNLSDTIDYINSKDRPLALYIFSSCGDVQEKIIKSTMSGGVCINDCAMHVSQADLPFGGIGASGMGQYHAYEGFLEFSKLRPIFTQAKKSAAVPLRPPYGQRFDKIFNFLLRFKL
ncbi:coniferyl aldehyde dehydrogenase [Microbulbifer sp. SSSA008]|uniref:coniferyl aldehyde dehydrogenase n=1 Tax=Microbulbifer sp. SSSA008 TaxID=3243380 RepID=UPI0040399E59